MHLNSGVDAIELLDFLKSIGLRTMSGVPDSTSGPLFTAIEADPDIVFVTMGLNDNFSYSFAADAIEAQIDTDLRRLTEALPEARFIVVEPFWYTSERPPSVPIIIEWVRDAAERYGADYIPGASTWIQGREDEMAADGLHPNDDGYAEMTRRMDAALLELGL